MNGITGDLVASKQELNENLIENQKITSEIYLLRRLCFREMTQTLL